MFVLEMKMRVWVSREIVLEQGILNDTLEDFFLQRVLQVIGETVSNETGVYAEITLTF